MLSANTEILKKEERYSMDSKNYSLQTGAVVAMCIK